MRHSRQLWPRGRAGITGEEAAAFAGQFLLQAHGGGVMLIARVPQGEKSRAVHEHVSGGHRGCGRSPRDGLHLCGWASPGWRCRGRGHWPDRRGRGRPAVRGVRPVCRGGSPAHCARAEARSGRRLCGSLERAFSISATKRRLRFPAMRFGWSSAARCLLARLRHWLDCWLNVEGEWLRVEG